jgi:phosphatidylglycerol:prolipoprotein diacylglycerol transferase
MTTQFPGLGLNFEINNVAFKVFGLSAYWYGILIAFALLLAMILALRSCEKFGISQDTLLDGVLIAVPCAIVFSRLYYVVFSWDEYKDNLLKIFDTRSGGLAIYGAVIGAALGAFVYTRIKKISFLNIFDFAVPYIILGQAIGRWGNFINQEAYGAPTDLLWRMNGTYIDKYVKGEGLDPAVWGVHPTFLYESLWNFAVFAFLIIFRRKKKLNGEVVSLYLILYGIGRAFIEGLRTDSLMLGNIRFSQMLSIVFIIVLVPLFIYRRVKLAKKTDEELAVIGQSKYGALLMKMKEEEEAEKEKASESAEDTSADAENEASDVDKITETATDDAKHETNTDANQSEDDITDKSDKEE